MVARPRFGLGLVTGVQQPWTAVQTASASACRGLSARAAVESQAKARDGLADRLAAGRSAITDETLVPARRSTRKLRLISSPFHTGCARSACERLPVAGAAITAYDPAVDRRALHAARLLAGEIARGASLA